MKNLLMYSDEHVKYLQSPGSYGNGTSEPSSLLRAQGPMEKVLGDLDMEALPLSEPSTMLRAQEPMEKVLGDLDMEALPPSKHSELRKTY